MLSEEKQQYLVSKKKIYAHQHRNTAH